MSLHLEQADTGRDTRNKGLSEKLDRGISSWTMILLVPAVAFADKGMTVAQAVYRSRDGEGATINHSITMCRQDRSSRYQKSSDGAQDSAGAIQVEAQGSKRSK